ncbi:MAG: hypothetical protein ABIP39_02225 [Polyangiaceae bacterium]
MGQKLFLLIPFFLVACGAPSSPSPVPGPGATASTSPESTNPPVSPADDAAVLPGPAGSTATPAGPAPAPSSTSFVTSEAAPSQDACGAVAAPFEEKVRARFNECYAAGKKKNPDLAGSIHIVVDVNPSGKIASVKAMGTSELGASVVDCMVKAVKKEPFDGSVCKGKTVAVGKTWGKR